VTALAHSHEEFKNDEVHVKVYRKQTCKVEMKVHASSSLIEKARPKAIKTVGKEVILPGFRKGKAPENMVLKKFGPQIDKELEKQLADLAYAEAQKLAKIPLLNNNAQVSYQMKKRTAEEAEMSFTFETEPVIPEVDGNLFELKSVERPETAQKQIDEAIRQMLFFYAEWTPVEGRPLQDGDTIMIDLETVEEGVPLKVFDGVRFEVSKERMADWMKQLVEGAKAGDVLEGVSRADESATEEEKSEFKPKNVRVTILKVEEAKLPELNDDFAKKVGAPDVEAMRASIINRLNKQADEKVESEQREQVNEFLIEKYPFELPHSLVETETKHRFQQLGQNPEFRENWETMTSDKRKKLVNDLESESNQAVRLFYLSRKIVNDAKISITHKEILDESVATLRSFGTRNLEKIPKEVYALALSKVMLAKAQDHILAQKK
jgi:trigger factor